MFMSQPSRAHMRMYRWPTESGLSQVEPSGETEKIRASGGSDRPSAAARSEQRRR
jgi:hypothetical protein